MSFYSDSHYLQHHNCTSMNALQSVFVASSQQCPPQLPLKKGKKNYRPISANSIIHSNIFNDPVRNTKRKSAVELLAESKPYYVKSGNVLDKKQQVLYQSTRTPFTSKSNVQLSPNPSLISPSHTFPHQRANTLNRRSDSTNSELLQMKLRRLINDSSSKDNVFDSCVLNAHHKSRQTNFDLKYTKFEPPQQFSSPKRLNQQLTIHSTIDINNDNDVMFPSAFLSPQSLPSNNTTIDDIYCDYKTSTILNDYQPISPPAEFTNPSNRKQDRSINYHRSYSHSQAVDVEEPDYASPTHKTNYKSLPDLHTQTNRNSPYSEYSEGRGNRSNKSNSSINRDSGGSSGHYTHKSEPFYKQDQHHKIQSKKNKYSNYNGPDRRDSGSSTQHSSNSYYEYGGAISRNECHQCDIQNVNGLHNFTTSVVPEAFQDHYSDSEQNVQFKHLLRSNCNVTPIQSNIVLKLPDGEISPPLGTFKRQKCLRIKQHGSRHPSPSDRTLNTEMDEHKPILRSKSDISHRYFNRNMQKFNHHLDDCNINEYQRTKNDHFNELERFFDRLGLTDAHTNSTNSNRSSPVFFSDIATIDSDQLPDSTETQLDTKPYRPIEPTSIVERNARIIKWLCTCRKMQVT